MHQRLVGKAMAASKGKANPAQVNELLKSATDVRRSHSV
jgi:Asp-tRNA(Asn)/Glu-tRNA(Gln) amidotransferase B subunit